MKFIFESYFFLPAFFFSFFEYMWKAISIFYMITNADDSLEYSTFF